SAVRSWTDSLALGSSGVVIAGLLSRVAGRVPSPGDDVAQGPEDFAASRGEQRLPKSLDPEGSRDLRARGGADGAGTGCMSRLLVEFAAASATTGPVPAGRPPAV